MAALTQCLPVIPVPEQSTVAPVRLDMVNDLSFHDQAQLNTVDAQRVIHQVQPPRLVPVPVIAAPVGVGSLFVTATAAASHLALEVHVLAAVAVGGGVATSEGAAGGGDQGGQWSVFCFDKGVNRTR